MSDRGARGGGAERGWGDGSPGRLGAGLSDCRDAFSTRRAGLSGPRQHHRWETTRKRNHCELPANPSESHRHNQCFVSGRLQDFSQVHPRGLIFSFLFFPHVKLWGYFAREQVEIMHFTHKANTGVTRAPGKPGMAVLSGSWPGPSLTGGGITGVGRLCFSEVCQQFPPRSRDG